jgi:hypothetical protein
MEVFLARIRQLLPVLGSDLLTPITRTGSIQKASILFCRIKGIEARGQRTATGFVVFRGSQAVIEERPSARDRYPYVLSSRRQLIAEGTLMANGPVLEFTKDAEFSSPSAAAAVIHGGSANGLIEWKTKEGTTLKELDEMA